MHEAMQIMEKGLKTGPKLGYMVSFEWAGDGFLRSDYFPDKRAGEDLIKTEREAWDMAKQFAAKTWGRCVNVSVIDSSFRPVDGYRERMIINR